MNNKLILKYLIFLTSFFLFNSCNTESIIENQGGVLDSNSEQQIIKKGKVAFYDISGNPSFFCSGGLKIYIDGNYVGTITDISSTPPQQCDIKSTTKVINAVLDVGTHTYSAYGTGTYCPKYMNRTITIENNVCLLIQF